MYILSKSQSAQPGDIIATSPTRTGILRHLQANIREYNASCHPADREPLPSSLPRVQRGRWLGYGGRGGYLSRVWITAADSLPAPAAADDLDIDVDNRPIALAMLAELGSG